MYIVVIVGIGIALGIATIAALRAIYHWMKNITKEQT